VAKAFVNGINIHYQRKGEGGDIVLVHGITSCLAQWYVKIFPELAREYSVTAYDLRGHGLSDITAHGYSSLSMAEDLKALLNYLGIEKTRLIGHSFGGAISLHFALLNPERVEGIVLLDSGLACLRYLRVVTDWPGWTLWKKELDEVGMNLERFVKADSKQDVTDIIRGSFSVPVRAGFRKGQTSLTPRLKKLLDGTAMGSEFREVAGLTEQRLRDIQTPVLAIYGATSPYEKMAEHLVALLPHCRHELLEDAGHFYAAEEPGLVLDRVRGFLRAPWDHLGCTRP
jgi:pimeloyl-ACP methyl ester carboxylesterase